ncbi:MAG: hypothetical protein SNG14_08560 [Rikenellaceae bacterium]
MEIISAFAIFFVALPNKQNLIALYIQRITNNINDMLDLIRDILTSPYGSFASVFAIFALAFYLVYYITKHITTINNNHSNLSKSIDKLDGNIDEIRKDMSFLKGSLDIIRSSSQDLLKAHSPISLTEKGKSVATELGADDIIARNWETIEQILNSEVEGKNPYDIQEYCLETVSVEPQRFFLPKDLDSIKTFAFANGQALSLYTRMLGIMIRDVYFGKKGINVSDIAKYEHQ